MSNINLLDIELELTKITAKIAMKYVSILEGNDEDSNIFIKKLSVPIQKYLDNLCKEQGWPLIDFEIQPVTENLSLFFEGETGAYLEYEDIEVVIKTPYEVIWSLLDSELDVNWFAEQFSETLIHEIGHVNQLVSKYNKIGKDVPIKSMSSINDEIEYFSSPIEIQMFALNAAKELTGKIEDTQEIKHLLSSSDNWKKLAKLSTAFGVYAVFFSKNYKKDPYNIRKAFRRFMSHLTKYLDKYEEKYAG